MSRICAPWTDAEERLLRYGYPYLGSRVSVALKRIGCERSQPSINSKRKNMGIEFVRYALPPPPPDSDWSPDEVAAISAAWDSIQSRMQHGGPGSKAVREVVTALSSLDTVTAHEHDDGTLQVDCPEGQSIRTLEALLEAAQVDLTAWVVERHKVKKWEVGMKGSDGRPIVTPLWAVSATLVRSCPFDPEGVADRIDAAMKRLRARPVKRKAAKATGRLLELALYDAHIGKLAHADETGNGGSLAQSCDDYLSACVSLLAGHAPDRIVYPVGNDLLNADGERNLTRGGHPQDQDGRWQHIHDAAAATVIESIERARQVAPVDVLLIPGNHDWHASYYLVREVAAYYRGVRDVTVDASPAPRKYYRWGDCLIGLSHGKYEAVANLPLVMAQERPTDWAETRFREWHLAHVHHTRTSTTRTDGEFQGVVVRQLRALSTTDAWHGERAYAGARAANAFVWGRSSGLVAMHQHMAA